MWMGLRVYTVVITEDVYPCGRVFGRVTIKELLIEQGQGKKKGYGYASVMQN